MGWLQRHVAVVAVVIVALSATGAVFAFARPTYHAPRAKLVDMTKQKHYTVPEIQRAFAGEGLHLRHVWHLTGMTFLATRRAGASTFLVTIFDPTRTVDFGSGGSSVLVDRLIGNAEVFYGGHDARFAGRIDAAADALAH